MVFLTKLSVTELVCDTDPHCEPLRVIDFTGVTDTLVVPVDDLDIVDDREGVELVRGVKEILKLGETVGEALRVLVTEVEAVCLVEAVELFEFDELRVPLVDAFGEADEISLAVDDGEAVFGAVCVDIGLLLRLIIPVCVMVGDKVFNILYLPVGDNVDESELVLEPVDDRVVVEDPLGVLVFK